MAGWSIVGNRYPFTYSEPPEQVVLRRTDYSDSVVYVPERTCRVVKNSRKYVLSDGTELFDDGCSICNGYIGAGENYCSNCGARVVE